MSIVRFYRGGSNEKAGSFLFSGSRAFGFRRKKEIFTRKTYFLTAKFFLIHRGTPTFSFFGAALPGQQCLFPNPSVCKAKTALHKYNRLCTKNFFAIRRKKCYQTNTFFPFLRLLCYKIKKSSMYFTYTPLVVISLAHDWAFSHGLQKTTGISM